MNVDEAIVRLGADAGFPKDAMEWALNHWDEAASRFVSKLRACAMRGEVPDGDGTAMFYIVHLCGEKGEPRAYEPLCRLVAADSGIDDWLGDASSETLPGILIKTYDGDPRPLVEAAASPDGDEYAQSSALMALSYLAQEKGALSRDEMKGLLRDLSRNPALESREVFWDVWASLAAHFGFGEFRSEIARQNRLGRLDGKEFDVREFDAIVERVRRNPGDQTEFERFRARPFEDAIGTLKDWVSDDLYETEEGRRFAIDRAIANDNGSDWPLDEPHVNPLRDVGRNDPCPCGSGKKYKKCCLAV